MKTARFRWLVPVLAMLLAGCGSTQRLDAALMNTGPATTEVPAPAGAGLYTYRTAVTAAPDNFSPFEWYTETEQTVLEYTSMGLYAAVPGEDGGSYDIVPEMAAAAPVDVTAQYAGSYGIPEDAAEGYAYEIALNPDACWEDGTPITAETYVESMKRLLSSEMKYYRASNWFSGQLVLAGAWDYFMQDLAGQTLYQSLADAGYGSVAEASNDGVSDFFLDMDGYWGMDCGWQNIESQESFRDEAIPEGEDEDYVTPQYIYETYLSDGSDYAAYQNSFVGVVEAQIPECGWDNVGLLKTDTYRIVLILECPVSAGNLAAGLCTSWLVKTDLYDADPSAYGTDAAHYASCGPYTLASIDSRELRFERNERWYGYSDGDHDGQYQATGIVCRILTAEQAVEGFESGQLDTVESAGEDAFAVPQTYTSKLTFNTSLASLARRESVSENINKTILSYRDFRKAVSLALDRQAFVKICVPTAEPTLTLLNDTFLANPETGERYRDTQAGTGVLTALYGTEDTASVTGFDLEQARALLQSAYDEAEADGRIDGDDTVELEFLTYSDDEVYRNIAGFLQNALDTAAEGTSLAGRIRIVMTPDPSYYATARSGEFEIILSTWGGDPTDPYSILGCYCDRDRLFEFGFDPSREICTITLDGNEISKTYRGWYTALTEGKYASADRSLREKILAELEYSLLAQYNCVPVYARNRVFRDSERLVRPVEEAVDLVGFGGVRYLRFTKDDAGLPAS